METIYISAEPSAWMVEHAEELLAEIEREKSRRVNWRDPDYGQDFTPAQTSYTYFAYRAGKWGRRLVEVFKWLGVFHRQHEMERGWCYCIDCNQYHHAYDPHWLLVVRSWSWAPRLTFNTLCPGRLLGRIAMWQLLRFVKRSRRGGAVRIGCGLCHACGTRLTRLEESGVQWCWQCGKWRAYRSHGYASRFYDDSECRWAGASPISPALRAGELDTRRAVQNDTAEVR